jgi:uncharacterized protein YndB with AHSA1/START domain
MEKIDMFSYTAERVIKRPASEVFSFLADVRKQTEWVHGVKECHWVEAESAGVGAIAEQSMTFMGKNRVVPMKVIDFQAGKRIVFEKEHPFRIRFGFELEEKDGATYVRYPVEMEPRGFFRVLIPLVGRKTINGDLVRIAKCLEAA